MNAKIYNGNVQPNHKEYKIWVNDEGIIKTWNGTEWIEQSGSGSGSGEASTFEYLDISNLGSTNKVNLVVKCNIIKIKKYGDIVCTAPAMLLTPMSSVGETLDCFADDTIAVCIDFNLVVKYPDGEFTNKELLLENGFTQEELDAIPRITKEEFYNLDNNNGPK